MASSLTCGDGRGLVLRQEVLRGARHTVIVSPAVDDRQLPPPVAVPGRGLRCLPLQRGGLPGIAAGKLAFVKARYQIEKEHDLGGAYDQCCYGDKDVQRRRRWRDKSRHAQLVIAARHAEQTEVVHREVNQIGPKERDPDVKLAE